MPSSLLQIRRSPAATVDAAIPAEGELAYKTDTKKLSIGDGSTLGGNGIVMDSQLATDTLAGIVEKATTGEARAGTANKFPDAAGVKSYVDQFGIGGVRDLRSTIYSTGVPSDLYGKGTVFGFADAGELGIAGYAVNSYGMLEVGYQWTDASGVASAYRRFVRGGVEFLQAAISSAAWGPWRLQYNQSNIVGTVSQSSGIPTGAIIEQGSNANGRYIKYADGTMICTGAITLNLTITTATGSVFVSTAAATVTYPTTFAATPTHFRVSQSASSSAWISATSPSSTTAGTVYLMASTSRAAQGYSATFLAIGRWY